jgi:hypothetical protein
MKIATALIILLLQCLITTAQLNNCKIKVVNNKVTSISRAEIDVITIGNETDNLFCSAFRTGNDFAVYFGLEMFNTTICFEPGLKALILFTDHTQSQVVNVQGANCKGNFLIKGTIENGVFQNSTALDWLTKKTVRAIRFQTTTGFLDFDVTDQNDRLTLNLANSLTRALECLKNWKE